MQELCSILFTHLESCIHYPGHLVDVNEVKNIWVILLHTEDDEVHQLQLHVFQPGILAVKHPGDLPVALLSLQPLQVVDQHLLHLLQAVGPLHVAAHGEDDQLAAVLGGEGSEPDRSRGGLSLSTHLVSVVSVERALVNDPHVQRILVQLIHSELLPPLESLDNTVDSLLCLLSRLIENMFPEPEIDRKRAAMSSL